MDDKLESVFLPGFLRGQRWFAGKARALRHVRIVDRAALADERLRLDILIVDVDYARGRPERYFVPLVAGGAPEDGLRSPAACGLLVEAILRGPPLKTSSGGTVRFSPTALWTGGAGPVGAARVVDQEQSNSAFFLGDRMFCKLFRRLHDGPNPEAEIGRFLARRQGYGRSPRLFGTLEYEGANAAATLGVLEESLDGCEDAWSHTLGELERYRDRCGGRTETDAAPSASWVREAARKYLRTAAELGCATAEMHLALATGDDDDPAFRPAQINAEDLTRWSKSMVEHAAHAFELLGSSLPGLPPDAALLARRALAGAADATTRLRDVRDFSTEGVKRIRCHGDYHLGQVLRRKIDGRLFIIDFEGEPERPVEERRSRMPAFKDVAGMLRSFAYAANAGLVSATAGRGHVETPSAACSSAWESAVAKEFLQNYRKGATKGSFLPDDGRSFERWIEVFLLEKAIYEIGYELNQRPEWVRIPLAGLISILAR